MGADLINKNDDGMTHTYSMLDVIPYGDFAVYNCSPKGTFVNQGPAKEDFFQVECIQATRNFSYPENFEDFKCVEQTSCNGYPHPEGNGVKGLDTTSSHHSAAAGYKAK